VLWIGFIILLGVLLTPIFLLSGLLTILRRMREKILTIFGSILLLFLIGCSKPEVECSLEKIEEYANKQCTPYAEYEECKQEVIYLIGVTCGVK